MRGTSRNGLLVCAVVSAMLVGPGTARSWNSEVVHAPSFPEFVSQHVSVAVDAVTGRTVIAYYESYNDDLWLAREVGAGGNCGPGGSFVCGLLDSTGDVGMHNSIAVTTDDAATTVWVSYHDATSSALKVVRAIYRHDGVPILLRRDTIQSGGMGVVKGLYTSLKLDSTGRPHVASQTTVAVGAEALMHAQFLDDGSGNCGIGAAAGDWQCGTVQSGEGIGRYASLAFGTSDNPKIAYYDANNDVPKYASFAGGLGWVVSTLGTASKDTGMYASLYVDDSNLPHIAYYNATDDTVEYAVPATGGNCGGGAWQCSAIDDAGPGCSDVAIVEDGAGFPFIVHHNRATGDHEVRAARPIAAVSGVLANCGPGTSWHCASIDDPDGADRFPGKSLGAALHPLTNGIVVAYCEDAPLSGYLKVAHDEDMPLFGDGFELGTTTLWSSATP